MFLLSLLDREGIGNPILHRTSLVKPGDIVTAAAASGEVVSVRQELDGEYIYEVKVTPHHNVWIRNRDVNYMIMSDVLQKTE